MHKEHPQLQIDSNVIRQLGDQLITDAEQALLELVKNSYDADASWARIVIDTSEGSGTLSVQDDGHGMSREAIQSGWLTISLSQKKEFKSEGKVTARFKRTPLGDKGLGRLGTMKLGDLLEIETFTDSRKPGYRVSIRWSDCKSGNLLGEVPVVLTEIPPSGKLGTTLKLLGLADRDYWKGEKRLAELQRKMSTLVSPFTQINNFDLFLEVDGETIELRTFTSKIRKAASIRLLIDWDDERLECRLLLKRAALRSQADEEFNRLVEKDKGKALFRFLAKKSRVPGLEINEADTREWYLELVRSWTWSELAAGEGQLRSRPGPFKGEIDSFDLGVGGDDEKPFSDVAEFRNYVKAQAGVGIFRDGFAVRMPPDWLGLGQSWTTGRSYYGLKPANTVGFIGLSAAGNPELYEKSDREGFLDSSASRGFLDICNSFVKFANDSLAHVRRSYLEFRDENSASAAGMNLSWSEADAVARLREVTRKAREKVEASRKAEAARRENLNRVQRLLKKSAAAELPKNVQMQIDEALRDVNQLLEEWNSAQQQIQELLNNLLDEQSIAEAIGNRLERLQRQTTELYETVAIGLVAQALAHEVHALLDDLLARCQKAQPRIARTSDPSLMGFLEATRGLTNSIRKQVTFLDPMLRTARETTQRIRLSTFMEEFFGFRSELAEKGNIKLRLEMRKDFTADLNRGRLLQVLDNLFRNSAYWLDQGKSNHREIRVVVDSPRIFFSDNGPGIKPAIERELFGLFVTDKPRGEGTGLGLFISRELLRDQGCEIWLDDLKNEHGRCYQFVIDLAAVLAREG